ncbi:MAG: hypothetical protein N2255_10835 [Kiritimatiellae bacterium]|nr:hypothetical protein [Kiritimatiellia bacterium]
MRRKLSEAQTFFVLLVTVAFVVMCGCDDADELAGAVFRIEPEQAILVEPGDTVILQAVGGEEPFRWTVSDGGLGSVTTGSVGRVVTYTRAGSNGANVVTVMDSRGWTATATIIQEDRYGGLSIQPSQASLAADGEITLFGAVGGTPPYSWSVSSGVRGLIEPRGEAQALYKRRAAGNNTVILTDARGQVAVAVVTQNPAGALAISPTTGTLSADGQILLFTASGGSLPYTWKVSSSSRGTITAQGKTQAIYTRLSEGENVVTVIDKRGQAATATITQPGPAVPAALTIAPPMASPASDGATVVFTASGGTLPYTWDVSSPALGSITPQGTRQAIYTRLQSGNNFVLVTDAAGQLALATITQPLPGIPTISPVTANIQADGDVALFTASGGTPPYSWSVVRNTRGTIVPQGPAQALYTRTSGGDNQVLVTDAAGHAALATVTQP